MKVELNKEISYLAEKYKRTGNEQEMRELLVGQMVELIRESESGEIAMSDFSDRLADLSSQADYFMRLRT